MAVVGAHHGCLDGLADLYGLFQDAVRVVGVIRRLDNAGRVVAKIHRDIFLGHSDYGSGHDIACIDLAEGSVDFCFVIFHCF